MFVAKKSYRLFVSILNFLKVTAPDYIEVRFVKTINKKNGICSQDPTLSFKNKIIVFRSFLTEL